MWSIWYHRGQSKEIYKTIYAGVLTVVLAPQGIWWVGGIGCVLELSGCALHVAPFRWVCVVTSSVAQHIVQSKIQRQGFWLRQELKVSLCLSVCLSVCSAQSAQEHSFFLFLAHIFKQTSSRLHDYFRMTQRALRRHSESTQKALKGHSTQRILKVQSESNQTSSYRRSLKYFVLFGRNFLLTQAFTAHCVIGNALIDIIKNDLFYGSHYFSHFVLWKSISFIWFSFYFNDARIWRGRSTYRYRGHHAAFFPSSSVGS